MRQGRGLSYRLALAGRAETKTRLPTIGGPAATPREPAPYGEPAI
jgi:hypothetical protein